MPVEFKGLARYNTCRLAQVVEMRLRLMLLVLALVLSPGLLRAQQSKMPVIGVLSTSSPASSSGEVFASFHLGLRDEGFTENRNVRIEYRWAYDDYSKLPAFAEELVRLRVAVIVAAGGHVSALEAHKVTKEIPIIFTTVTDPVKDGLVASLNRPGGNATGTAGLTSELDPKRLEILREIIPTASVIGVLVNPNRPGLQAQLAELQEAADKLKVTLEIRRAANDREIDAAFASLVEQKVHGIIVTADPLFTNRRSQVVALAANSAIPTIYQWRQFVSVGGLISYGPSITEAYRHAGANAGRVLKGVRPADIPVVQPSRFELSINRWTARQLGLTLPASVLSRADEIIE
jgi:putative tryptophan/tyrosine transport system substrate-binding protein